MGSVHVVPLHDLVAHDVPGGLDSQDKAHTAGWLSIEADENTPGEPCICAPAVEHVPNPDGPDGWVIVHHSLDGRELNER